MNDSTKMFGDKTERRLTGVKLEIRTLPDVMQFQNTQLQISAVFL